MSDDEWYERYCGAKAALIKADHAKYKSDALFYRATLEVRYEFRAKVKEILAWHKKPSGMNGPL